MSWNAERMASVAVASAPQDYAAFEAIGLSEIPKAHVLDVGCYDGYNTRLKFTCYSNIERIVGIDVFDEAIAKAEELTDDPRFEWVCAGAEDYDGEDGAFDVAYFSHSFQHVRNKEATLANVYRMLKPGGVVAIKTFDDSAKLSYPDPGNVMRRLFALYEAEVAPRIEHTRYTDRNNGHKCPSLLRQAGFEDIEVRVHMTDTLNKSVDERRDLFERFTYFRVKTPDDAPSWVAEQQRELLAAWKELFEDEGYYHASNTFMVLASKPYDEKDSAPSAAAQFRRDTRSGGGSRGGALSGGESWGDVLSGGESRGDDLQGQISEHYAGVNLSCRRSQFSYDKSLAAAHKKDSPPSRAVQSTDTVLEAEDLESDSPSVFTIVPMRESDLGEVMAIELASFPDPWTPVAYAMELRHNRNARYSIARDASGAAVGYVGWWSAGGGTAVLAHIAVSPQSRRRGVATALMEHICSEAKERGCLLMQLQVRFRNDAARSFYTRCGFAEASLSEGYYTNPDDDAVIMVKEL